MRKDLSAIGLHSRLLPYSRSFTSTTRIEVLLTLASALCPYSIRELCHRLPCRRQVSPARIMGYRWTRRLRAPATTRLQPSPRNPHSLLHLKSRFPAEHHNEMVRWRNLPALPCPLSNNNIRHPEVLERCPGVPIILVGLKKDLRDDPVAQEEMRKRSEKFLTSDEGEDVRKRIGAKKYLECSSLTGEGVDDVFEAATRQSLLSGDHKKQSGCCVIL